ncbi:hypothetical protein ElyMa_002584100 [Elysia marginata]|uniref:Reverse transcriptase domain-containing protein n=1 Tax=Elysia marginata TaxID=1093978 RepID=A0AAV4H2P9_9GAST|nr:hypothetical protein ElyMa_002584100 [Elysia marginata]
MPKRWTFWGLQQLDGQITKGLEEEDANHTEEVGLMLFRQAAKSLLGWQPEGSRIVPAMFKIIKKKISLRAINWYASINEKGEDIKEQFYARLHDVLEKFKAKDITNLIGDLNVPIGNDNMGYEKIMGNQSIGRMNEN